ncbi:MAG: acyl-CoA thioesterase II [Pseudomonadota bacterium]
MANQEAARDPLETLLQLLDVEQLDTLFFRGRSEYSGSIRVFGGHVIGQSVAAALRTADHERQLHSMHAYFLRPGKPNQPIIYQVDPIRDGGSFNTRRVVAYQSGEAIFNTSLSFHMRQSGPEHELDVPGKPEGPEGLMSNEEMWRQLHAAHPDKLPAPMNLPSAIDVRPLKLRNPMQPSPSEPTNWVWMKTKHTVPSQAEQPDNTIHQKLFAYMSDMQLLGTSLQPHSLNFTDPDFQMASLDHGIWFHDDFRVDDWLLLYMDSPVARNARGFNRGLVWDASGRLVASTVQEGLLRPKTR